MHSLKQLFSQRKPSLCEVGLLGCGLEFVALLIKSDQADYPKNVVII